MSILYKTPKPKVEENDKETKPLSTTSSTKSFFGGGGTGFFTKSPNIDISKEPLGEYYENRKKIIFGKENIIGDEYFISQFLLNSQKKLNKEYNKMTSSGSAFFFDVPHKIYPLCLTIKENIANFCLIIHLYLALNKDDKALEIFLLLCKENKKKLEYMYTKLDKYCKKSAPMMIKYTPSIAKMLTTILSCLIKFSVKFCKTNWQNIFFTIYIKTMFILNYRQIKSSISLDNKNDIIYNRLYIYTSCLFDSAIFHFYNYYPLEISTKLLQHILELYNDNNDNNDNYREKNYNELIIMMKSNFNSGYFYFVDGKYKEAMSSLHSAKELIADIIQYNLNSKEDEKEFLNSLSGYSYLNEERNTLFCLKIYNKRISKLHDKAMNLSQYIKDNMNQQGKKASSFVLGSKKYELKLPLLLEQIKRKINLEIDLLLCQIEMIKKNYKAAFEQINLILKSNTIKDDFETKAPVRKKRLGVNKNFKSLKTYQNIRVKPKIEESDDSKGKTDLGDKEYYLIFLLLEKIEHELSTQDMVDEMAFGFRKKTVNLKYNKPLLTMNFTNYTNFKELEKFFIFICSLSLFQLKILNESQPPYSHKRDDLPIIFTTSFRDSLTYSQRRDLDEIETMSLSRYIILVDSMKEISPENLDYKYMKYKIKTTINNDEEENEEEEADFRLSFDEEEKNKKERKKGRNDGRKNIYENKGIYSLSSNIINSTNVSGKTNNNNIRRKRTTTKRSLSFDDEFEDENKLDLLIKNIKNKKNEKFLHKFKKRIVEYLYSLNPMERQFFFKNPNLLEKMTENIRKEINKKELKEKNIFTKDKNIFLKNNENSSYSYSFEVSQKTLNYPNK